MTYVPHKTGQENINPGTNGENGQLSLSNNSCLQENESEDIIKFIHAWRSLFKWLRYKEINICYDVPTLMYFFSCSICSSSVYKISSKSDTLFISGVLRKHEKSEQHVLGMIRKDPKAFGAIFQTLRKYPHSYSSSNDLLSPLRSKLNEDFNFIDKYTLQTASHMINNLIQRHSFRAISEHKYSVVYDSTGEILIFRFVNYSLQTKEFFIPASSSTSNCLQQFFHEAHNSPLVVITDNQAHPNVRGYKTINEVPLRLPKIDDLLMFIKKSGAFDRYCCMVDEIFDAYSLRAAYFNHISDSDVLKNSNWSNIDLYHFIFKNLDGLKVVLRTLTAEFGKAYPYTASFQMQHGFLYGFQIFIHSVKTIMDGEYDRDSWELVRNVLIHYQNFLSEVQQKYKTNIAQKKVLQYIKLFVDEIQKPMYHHYRDRRFMSSFLFNVSAMRNLKGLPIVFNLFNQLANFFRISLEERLALIEQLSKFASYLSLVPSLRVFSLDFALMKLNELNVGEFSSLRELYQMVAALPYLPADDEKSVFQLQLFRRYFQEKYGTEFGNHILSIHLHGSSDAKEWDKLFELFSSDDWEHWANT